MAETGRPDAQAIIDAVERLAPHALIDELAGHFDGAGGRALALAVVARDKMIVDLMPYLDKLRDAPRRIETTARVTQVASFIDYLKRFRLDDSAIFAADDPDEPSLLGIVDFHGGVANAATADPLPAGATPESVDATPGSSAVPRFGRHCVRYDFPVSEQVRAWSAISGCAMTHAEMATFLAERQYDIANPPLDWMQVDRATVDLILHLMNIGDDAGAVDDDRPDEEPDPDGDDRYIPRGALYKLRQIRFASARRLAEMARTVEISADRQVTAGYQPKTGERTLVFAEEHAVRDGQGRKVIVPDAFLLRVPIWEGETAQLVPVRLQYRLVRGAVAWTFTLIEWRRVIRFAVRTEAERVRQATELPVFYGERDDAAAK